jgi:hypothetical protein
MVKTCFIYICLALLHLNLINSEAKVEDFVKIRCALSGKSIFYSWNGTIFNYMPQQKPELLFKFIGFNVARCLKTDDGSWQLLTRELSYYLDPQTDEKLSKWTNPYSGEILNVVHVSNDPVNSHLSPVSIEKITNQTGAVVSDITLFYPNPLNGNDTFQEYGGINKFYEAGEFFKFYFDLNDLNNSDDNLDKVTIAWNRIGPYLPWMKMGSIQGQIVYSTYGSKVESIKHLPDWLQDDVIKRLPLYLHAPKNYETPNETAFTYFKKHFDEYLRGEQFPISTKVDETIQNSASDKFILISN